MVILLERLRQATKFSGENVQKLGRGSTWVPLEYKCGVPRITAIRTCSTVFIDSTETYTLSQHY